ncbi:MAG TPA: peptidase T [Sediminispirochaeta sp.]|nr:peptidase T [Sediminispirochaeta sp.]
MKSHDTKWIQKDLLDRFLRYVQIETTSDPHIEAIPSTPGQWDLLKLLKRELEEMGVEDVELDQHGYLIARIPARGDRSGAPIIGFMAHVDTASDVSGRVKPKVFEDYDGGELEIGQGYRLSPEENSELRNYLGGTIITSDGSSLLGADDKAGVAEIMTAVRWIMEHPDFEHGTFEVIFTPDEETGKGMNLFPKEKLTAACCYTFDGGARGEIEAECFNAYAAKIKFHGQVVHLGDARGKLVNALTMASKYVSMLPQNEAPESTDGRFGYYAPIEMKAGLDEAELTVFLRDFEQKSMEHRIEVLLTIAAAVEQIYHGGKVEVETKKVYSNMRDYISAEPKIMELLKKAIEAAGVDPLDTIIRGGTDGARLSEMGIPTPNVFAGGHNFHSRHEWAALQAMEEATETILNLIRLWSEE